MRISRLWCPKCQDSVLFQGMTHARCGYRIVLAPERAEKFGGGYKRTPKKPPNPQKYPKSA